MLPFDWQEKGIEVGDLDLLSMEFSRIVKSSINCESVYFAGPEADAVIQAEWKAGVEMVRNDRNGVWNSNGEVTLYLPVWSNETLAGVAVLKDCDGEVRSFSSDRLLSVSRQISREMRLVKESFVDPVTGLLNGKALNSRLKNVQRSLLDDRHPSVFSLLLVELYPRVSDAGQALSAIKKSAAFLSSLVGHLAVPCHLGCSIFGLVWEGIGEKEALNTADLLLRWLKRENFPRGHIGITSSDIEPRSAAEEKVFLDQAWKALEIARKRSPFALCSYRSVSNHCVHPFRTPSVQVLARLRSLWKNSENFGLVQLHIDNGCSVENFVAMFSSRIGEKPHVELDRGDFLVFLDGCAEEQALKWCRDTQEYMDSKGVKISMGLAFYPCLPFRKNDMPGNCQRALMHAGFYGPGSLTVFNAVSLNISGDIYYNEGDLSQAVREYKKGRMLDPGNANLMNSLGVTYANMSRYAEAVAQFEEVLTRDEDNFMALYNLGFAHLALDNKEKALIFLERAYRAGEENFDLLLHLGKLYCRKGHYNEALEVLTQAETLGPVKVSEVSHGAVHRYLGEAYLEIGEQEKAIVSLQRAVRHNPADGTAISMLGELYSEANQGDAIALSLCRKAVDLEPGQSDNWLRLGRVQMRQGDVAEAVQSFQQGAACKRKKPDLFFCLGQASERLGHQATAKKYYKKALKMRPDYRDAADALQCMMDHTVREQ